MKLGVLGICLCVAVPGLAAERLEKLSLQRAIKIALEINLGQALLTQTAWMSVPSAHAAGFASGLLLASAILYE